MLNVVVLNWKCYLGMGSLYTNRMYSMVKRHLTLPHEFTEITEHDVPAGFTDWFNKLSLLSMFDDEVLYLDLDLIVTANIDHLVRLGRSAPSLLWARNDFAYPVSPNSKIVGDGYAGPLMENGREATINSSVMWWQGKRSVPQRAGVHGDQGCITAALWPDGIGLFPNDSIKSYKYHPGEVAPIVVLHGQPKNHELPNDPLIRTHWR